MTEFKNPTPVVVALIPIHNEGVIQGLLAIRRGDGLKVGHWALPGGYLEIEEWREGLAREVWEELGIKINPESFSAYDVSSGMNNEVVVIFGLCQSLPRSILSNFVPNREVTDIEVLTAPRELAFPAHTRVVERFFRSSGMVTQ